MKKLFFTYALLAVAISGCAPKQPQMSRQEWINTTTRTYAGITKDQAMEATEKLFRLADGDDFTVTHAEDGLSAVRQWSIYMVIAAAFGTDYWTVRAAQDGDKVKVSVQASVQNQAIGPMMTAGGDISASAMPVIGTPVTGTALYDLFFARLDYLLGKRDTWMTCEDEKHRIKSKITWGIDDPLCSAANMKDDTPEAIITASDAK